MSAESHYRSFLNLSQRMLVAGKKQEWDELIQLERQRAVLQTEIPRPVPPNATNTVVELIHQIQQCDAELQEKVGIWMKHARILLRMDSNTSLKP